MTTLLIATRNRHKVEEIRAILGDAFHFLTLNDFPAAPPVEEDAPTFAGNAAKKALSLADWLKTNENPALHREPCLVLADDSGLEVDALNGAPGVHSARFATLVGQASRLSSCAPGIHSAQFTAPDSNGNAPDADNNAKLLRLLQNVPEAQRTARFRCVIALAPVGGGQESVRFFDGTCAGRIQSAASGQGGFGYDPLFVPDGFQQSFAELGSEVKNRLSHRSQALMQLKNWLAK